MGLTVNLFVINMHLHLAGMLYILYSGIMLTENNFANATKMFQFYEGELRATSPFHTISDRIVN